MVTYIDGQKASGSFDKASQINTDSGKTVQDEFSELNSQLNQKSNIKITERITATVTGTGGQDLSVPLEIPAGKKVEGVMYYGCNPATNWNTYGILNYINDTQINLHIFGSGSQQFNVRYKICYS